MRIIQTHGLFACARVCPGTFQIDKLVDNGVLRGCCRSDTDPTSKAADIHGIELAFHHQQLHLYEDLTFSIGNRTRPAPSDTSLWDGTEVNATIGYPEELVQSKSGFNMYFLDSRSCLRMINRANHLVTTILGDCASGTLSITGVEDGQATGMAYLEEDQMFVFSISSYGLYLCRRTGRQDFDECKKVIDASDYTSFGQQMGRQLVRGRMDNGTHNNEIWQKVTNGINRYDLTSSIMAYEDDSMPMLSFDNQKFIRYISASTSGQLDSTAQHQVDTVDLGDDDIAMVFPPSENLILLTDAEQHKMYFMDVKRSAGQDVLWDACAVGYARTGNEIRTLDYCDFNDAANQVLDLLFGEYEPEPEFPAEDIYSITTVDLPDPYPETEELEFLCLNTLQVDMSNEERLLVGVCRPIFSHADATSTSGIGYLPIKVLDGQLPAGVTVLFGNPGTVDLQQFVDISDGVGTSVIIAYPEHLIQTSDGESMYFVDARSCLRKISRTSQQVTTVIGDCQGASLGIPGATDNKVYGMAYFESRQLFVFTVEYRGLYVCYEANATTEYYTCKNIIPNSNLEGKEGGISRGFDMNGAQNNHIWQKVDCGVNRYDMTEVFNNLSSGAVEIMADDEAFVRYARVCEDYDLESDAWYKDNTQTLESYSGDSIFLSQDAQMKSYCNKTDGNVVEDDVERCTFINITGGVWLHGRRMAVVTERNPDRIRIVQFGEPVPPTTEPGEQAEISTLGQSSGNPVGGLAGWTLACITVCLWITVLSNC